MIIDRLYWFVERIWEVVFSSFHTWDSFTGALGTIPYALVSFSSSLAWPYLLSNLGMAWLVYLYVKRKGTAKVSSFKAFAFPSHIYRHPSSLLDARFMAVDLILNALLYVPIYTGIGMVSEKLLSAVLVRRLAWEPPSMLSPGEFVLTSMVFFILIDFANYWVHVWCHRSPLLWPFHAVHHSAEVLTPATSYRIHPVENIVAATLHAPVLGLSALYFQNIVGPENQVLMIGGVSLFGFLVQAVGTHLKHSHIWISYGPWLDHVLISPAHHQIHHSVDPKHWDKNFGGRFAIWDVLFGTVYLPRTAEALSVGLPERDGPPPRTVAELYAQPFGSAARCLRRRLGSMTPRRFELARFGRLVIARGKNA
jgi:sterol desaturase/sphingolipid hydroxylase (fatty acid hydroxylase superfamily)